MTGLDAYNGLNTPKLTVPNELRPTWSGRGWLIHPLGNVSITSEYFNSKFKLTDSHRTLGGP